MIQLPITSYFYQLHISGSQWKMLPQGIWWIGLLCSWRWGTWRRWACPTRSGWSWRTGWGSACLSGWQCWRWWTDWSRECRTRGAAWPGWPLSRRRSERRRGPGPRWKWWSSCCWLDGFAFWWDWVLGFLVFCWVQRVTCSARWASIKKQG